MFEVVWTTQAANDMQYWALAHDRRRIDRIKALVESIRVDPYRGIGKPERLRGNLAGCWSRRIDREHRLVYRPTQDGARVEVLAARFHYEK